MIKFLRFYKFFYVQNTKETQEKFFPQKVRLSQEAYTQRDDEIRLSLNSKTKSSHVAKIVMKPEREPRMT